MRATWAGLVTVALLVSAPASAKEFRHYFGMQWVVTPALDLPSTISLKSGGTVLQAPMLTEDLFETSEPVSVGGKSILGAGAQLATARSALVIRCTIGRGDKGTLSYSRRVCLTDDDRDGQFDHYFDVGLGQGGGDVQFSGCVPNDRMAIQPITMRAVDPSSQREPMNFRVELVRIHGKRMKTGGRVIGIENATYEFGGSIGRNDRIWNRYSFCLRGYCRVPLGQIMTTPREGGFGLKVIRQDGETAVIEVARNMEPWDYWNMSRGQRPDPLYCPGTLFVETDIATF